MFWHGEFLPAYLRYYGFCMILILRKYSCSRSFCFIDLKYFHRYQNVSDTNDLTSYEWYYDSSSCAIIGQWQSRSSVCVVNRHGCCRGRFCPKCEELLSGRILVFLPVLNSSWVINCIVQFWVCQMWWLNQRVFSISRSVRQKLT